MNEEIKTALNPNELGLRQDKDDTISDCYCELGTKYVSARIKVYITAQHVSFRVQVRT